MSSIGSRFKVLGLTVLALCGLTALMATSAQANWLVNGVEVMVSESVTAKAHMSGKLVVEKMNLEFRCPTLVSEGLKIIGKSKEATGEIKFTGCKGFDNKTGTELVHCEPTSGGESGVIRVEGKALIVKLATSLGGTLKTWLLIEPEVSKPLATIQLSELCALAETSNLTGSLVAECGELVENEKMFKFVGKDCSVGQKINLLQAATPTIFFKGTGDAEQIKDELLFAGFQAKPQGIVSAELESGNSWAGDA